MAKIGTDGRWSAAACVLISFFCGLSVQTSGIFLPVFAGNIGATKLQIGIIAGLYGAAYLVSSLICGRQSDIRGRLPFIRLGLGLTVLAYIAQLLVTAPIPLIVVRTVLGACVAMSDAALMAYNFDAGGRTGKFASLAALGWLLGAVIAIFYQNYHGLFILSSVASAAAFGISWTLRKEETRQRVRPALFRTIGKNYRVYLPYFMRNVGANMVWFILPLFLMSLGATMAWVAILQCVNVGAQFLMMMWADRLKASRLVMVGLLTSALVFIIYGLARNYLQLLPAQLILAASWSALYIGSLMLLFKNTEARATSAAVLFSSGSLSQAIGPFMGGFVVQWWGYGPLMYVAAAFSMAGAGIAALPASPAGTQKEVTRPGDK